MFKYNEATIVAMPRRYDIFLALPLILASCTTATVHKVDPSLIADFHASTAEGCTPLYVTFTDLSTGQVNTWKWDFGDGHSSIDKAPNHTYNEPGIYTVSLLITGPDGSDMATKVDYIQVKSDIISWQDATHYIGQTKTVEGIIVEASFVPELKGKPTFLNFHKQYQSYFKCIIWYSDRISFLKAFPPNPETHLLNKRIRVTGMIEEYPEGSGLPEIILKIPSQIYVVGE